MSIHFESPLQMLRLLRGAPLSVLYGLWLARAMRIGVVGNEWLERSTGYSDKPISQALALLEEYGLATHTRVGWALTSGAEQLPLMNLDLEGPDNNNPEPSNSFDRATMQSELQAPVADGSAVSRNISESENFRLSSSSRSLNLDSRNENLPLPDSRAAESENFRLLLAELDRNGIRDPARSRLAKMPDVTVDLVRYHCETSTNTGQAVYRIEHNWTIPKNWRQARQASLLPENPPDPEEDPAGPDIEISEEVENLWKAILAEIRPGIAKAEFDTWASGLDPVGMEGETLIIRACNSIGKEWIEKRLGSRKVRVTI